MHGFGTSAVTLLTRYSRHYHGDEDKSTNNWHLPQPGERNYEVSVPIIQRVPRLEILTLGTSVSRILIRCLYIATKLEGIPAPRDTSTTRLVTQINHSCLMSSTAGTYDGRESHPYIVRSNPLKHRPEL